MSGQVTDSPLVRARGLGRELAGHRAMDGYATRPTDASRGAPDAHRRARSASGTMP
jgi:hypothetical protein